MPILRISNVSLAANTISASMIQDLTVNSADISDNAITSAKLSNSAVVSSKIATSSIDSSKFIANIDLANKGDYLVLPSGTTDRRPVGTTPGMIRFNTTANVAEVYQSNVWAPINGGATGGIGNFVFYENDANVTVDYTITSGRNAMSAGPITILSNVTVTIPAGSFWTVI